MYKDGKITNGTRYITLGISYIIHTFLLLINERHVANVVQPVTLQQTMCE